jgi:hypothetical protein
MHIDTLDKLSWEESTHSSEDHNKKMIEQLLMTDDYQEERTIILWWLASLSKMFQLYRGGQFIGGGNQGKLPACPKSLPNFITKCCIVYTSHDSDSNSQL